MVLAMAVPVIALSAMAEGYGLAAFGGYVGYLLAFTFYRYSERT
jgi:hypothetical protein